MSGGENRILIKIGQNFEANASGTFAVGAVLIIVLIVAFVGYKFV